MTLSIIAILALLAGLLEVWRGSHQVCDLTAPKLAAGLTLIVLGVSAQICGLAILFGEL